MRTRTSTASVGALAMLIGMMMVVAIPTALAVLPGWADRYGPLVYLAFLEYIAIAAGLVWWGVHELRS